MLQYPSSWPIWTRSLQRLFILYLVGPPEDSYSFGYCSSLDPGQTHLCSAGGRPHHCLVLVGRPLVGVCSDCDSVPIIRREVALAFKLFALGLLGGKWTQAAAYGCILVVATPVGECPGAMLTVARRIVATSDRGGRLWRQSCHEAWLFLFSVFFSILFSTYVHAAFGGVGSRWQPLNVTGRHA
jgi:hypothetical protein